jgi:hypothetical protein
MLRAGGERPDVQIGQVEHFEIVKRLGQPGQCDRTSPNLELVRRNQRTVQRCGYPSRGGREGQHAGQSTQTRPSLPSMNMKMQWSMLYEYRILSEGGGSCPTGGKVTAWEGW